MAYKGTAYHGYQRQDNAVTVQEVVEKCVSRVLNTPTEIIGCSRTDTGVHANAYCFSVKTDREIPVRNFVRGVNGYLPSDITLLSCEEADEDFHARYSCKGKEYVYLIHNSECRNPFAEDLQYHYRRHMDLELMRKAAGYFVGTHDFSSFCSQASEKTNTVRTVNSLSIDRNGNLVTVTISGDGFLYNMVRIIVGTLIDAGHHKITAKEVKNILELKDRSKSPETAPAKGLFLYRVKY